MYNNIMKPRDDKRSHLAFIERGTGPVVLLVHGFPLDHSMWDAQIESLGQTHRVIAPDLRGFGRSRVVPGTATMDQMADDLAEVLDALDVREPVALVGLSMGGYVAMAFCRKHAARVGALVLCDTRAAADAPEAAQTRSETARRVLAEGTESLVEAMIPKLFAPNTFEDGPEAVERVKAMIRRADPRGVAAALLGMAQLPDSTDVLSRLDRPTLMLVGEHDVLSPPAEMRAMADAMPNASVVEIAAAGHLSPMERPDAVSDAIARFLTECGIATRS
ncbi:MAG TPA: alpha/beta hydrolase [Planctomycetaceae bacterium]|nr:alpha/beta hydrolase [Planctomycetaceae bacterium]